MVENLAVESTKCKFDRLSRSDRRLVGWVKYRLSKSSKPWIHLCLPTFCKATGIGLRTAKRSLQKIRNDPQTEIVARTINENGRWQILVSSCARLHGLKRSEPFVNLENGKKRIVKDQIRGKQINEEQLILNENPVLWKAKSNDSLSTDQEVGGLEQKTENPCDPNQLTLNQLLQEEPKKSKTDNADLRPKTQCHFWDRHTKGGFTKVNQRYKHGVADFGVKTRRLAFVIARSELQREHWDNCKIRFSMAHGFNYALRELQAGCKRRTIVKAYQMALKQMHAIAVDAGETKVCWSASSSVSRAGRILRDGECQGKWWLSVAKESQQVIVSADAQP